MEQMIITLGDGSKVRQTTFDNFPQWAICYAYYGLDSAGDLSDEEIALVDDITAQYGRIVDSDENASFSHSPLFGLACDVCTATFFKEI